jgi:ABC-2 type transport system ATP-binding protein
VLCDGRLVAVAPPAELGGRDSAAAVVIWQGPDGPCEAVTDRPTALVASLATEYGGEVPGLTVSRPTLEDVYLRMIGGAE